MENKRDNKIKDSLICPNCGGHLIFLMPSGTKLSCTKCNKYFINDNGNVGKEIEKPKIDKNKYY